MGNEVVVVQAERNASRCETLHGPHVEVMCRFVLAANSFFQVGRCNTIYPSRVCVCVTATVPKESRLVVNCWPVLCRPQQIVQGTAWLRDSGSRAPCVFRCKILFPIHWIACASLQY